jgi:hemolysin III
MMNDAAAPTQAVGTVGTVEKPAMRGVLHQVAAVVAVFAGGGLTLWAATTRGAVSALLFTLSVVTLFTVSATYHRINWSPKRRAMMRRADHASIFILIAGTYTPMAIAALPPALGQKMLLIVWAGAAVGVLQSLFWIHAPKIVAPAIAVALGWVVIIFWKETVEALSATEMGLIFAGGVAYTLGAVAYAAKRPNPSPKVFGYHEVFHAMTLVGAGLHYVAIVSMVGRAT